MIPVSLLLITSDEKMCKFLELADAHFSGFINLVENAS